MSKAVPGKYKNGTVKLEDDVGWPEDQDVLVIPRNKTGKSIVERMGRKKKRTTSKDDALIEEIIENTESGEGID
jgi:hypothetical protein